MNFTLCKLYLNKPDLKKGKKCLFGEEINGLMMELNIYLLLSVIWPVNMKGVFMYGFTYVFICVTWGRPVLTKFEL